jgi:hypothetical protein
LKLPLGVPPYDATSNFFNEFWNQIIFFISKDENLTKAHIRYLEGKLIDQARQANRAIVVNGQSSGAKLPESDREDMEVFLEKIYQLLPVLGVELLVSATGKAATSTEKEMLYCERAFVPKAALLLMAFLF